MPGVWQLHQGPGGRRSRRASAAVAGAALIALGFTAAAPSRASAECDLSDPDRTTVVRVDDGETLTLADGTVARLIGAKAPAPPIGWQGEHPWPMVEEAKQALTDLADGKDVELRYGGTRTDRYGHRLAQVFVIDGERRIWLQGELVGRGLARVYSFPDNTACVAELLQREEKARVEQLGVWASWAYRVLDAKDLERLGRLTHTYQLVEGTVMTVGEAGGRVYLNFDKDWHSDFTLMIDREDKAAFKQAGIDWKSLQGKRVRARGWLEWWNGPMIKTSHPEQIELRPDAEAAPAATEPDARRAPNGNSL